MVEIESNSLSKDSFRGHHVFGVDKKGLFCKHCNKRFGPPSYFAAKELRSHAAIKHRITIEASDVVKMDFPGTPEHMRRRGIPGTPEHMRRRGIIASIWNQLEETEMGGYYWGRFIIGWGIILFTGILALVGWIDSEVILISWPVGLYVSIPLLPANPFELFEIVDYTGRPPVSQRQQSGSFYNSHNYRCICGHVQSFDRPQGRPICPSCGKGMWRS